VAEDDFYPGGFQDLTEALAVLRIPVDDQVGLAPAKPSIPSVSWRATCVIHWPLGEMVVPHTCTRRERNSITNKV